MLLAPTGGSEPRNETRPVTTTDLLKFVGVTAFLLDHYGLCFDPDQTWWRVLGRVAAPIFFFLIGFARTRSVAWTWIAYGAVLTAQEVWTSRDGGRLRDISVDILLNFAVLRLAVLPLVERILLRRAPSPLLVIGCMLLVPLTHYFLEYGIYGWLWALLGLSHRLALENPTPVRRRIRLALALLAAGVYYVVEETADHGFGVQEFLTVKAATLAALIAGLTAGLLVFRRTVLRVQPPAPLAPLFRFCGRYSLEIYAITLFAMRLLAHAIDSDPGADGGEDEDSGDGDEDQAFERDAGAGTRRDSPA
jgi:hypothetical protein